MSASRWVLLGAAPVGRAWFTELARWSTAGIVPVDFVKCLSSEDVRHRLREGRTASAVIVDHATPGLDRDLVGEAIARGCVVLVVGGRAGADLGTTDLPERFARHDLLAALAQHAQAVPQVAEADPAEPPPAGWRGDLVVVTGHPGAGRSTVAIALAQHLAVDPRWAGSTALADLSLQPDLALLHDAPRLVPGLPELVEAHRGTTPPATSVRRLLHHVPARRYDLLLGLRRRREWATLGPRAVSAAIAGLQLAYRVVVADTDPDVEGVAATGSADVEERNALARAAARAAAVVLVVGRPTVHGCHRSTQVLAELVELGVHPERLQPVVVGRPRTRRGRAEVARCLATLLDATTHLPNQAGGRGAALPPLASPVFVPLRPGVEVAVRDGTAVPASVGQPVAAAVGPALLRVRSVAGDSHQPDAIRPGSLAARAAAS